MRNTLVALLAFGIALFAVVQSHSTPIRAQESDDTQPPAVKPDAEKPEGAKPAPPKGTTIELPPKDLVPGTFYASRHAVGVGRMQADGLRRHHADYSKRGMVTLPVGYMLEYKAGETHYSEEALKALNKLPIMRLEAWTSSSTRQFWTGFKGPSLVEAEIWGSRFNAWEGSGSFGASLAKLPKLERLELHRTGISETAFFEEFKSSTLEELNLDSVTGERAPKGWLNSFPKLELFQATWSSVVTDDSLVLDAKSSVRSLELDALKNVGEGFAKAFATFGQLHKLHLSSMKIPNASKLPWGDLTALKDIDVSGGEGIDFGTLVALKGTSLESLSVKSFSPKDNDLTALLKVVSGFKVLRMLDLIGNQNVLDEHFKGVNPPQSLREFRAGSVDQTASDEHLAAYISSAKGLELLQLWGKNTERVWSAVMGLTKLQHLEAGWSSGLTGELLLRCKSLQTLERVEMSGIDDVSQVDALVKMTKLQHLNLHGWKSLDASHYKRFGSSLSALTVLELGQCGVSDESVEAIDSLKQLEFLSLYDNDKLTDEALSTLNKCASLKELDVRYCDGMTREAIAQWIEQHPDVHVFTSQ